MDASAKPLGHLPRQSNAERRSIAARLKDLASQAAARAWAANLAKDAQYLDERGDVQLIRASRVRSLLEAGTVERENQ